MEAEATPASDPGAPEGPAPRRWPWARWAKRVGVALALLTASGVAAALALVWPYVRDDLVLDRVVLAVALDWRDFGRDKAQARLEYELDHQAIGLQVADESCALDEVDGLRRVRCAWSAAVRVPVVELTIPVSFASQAQVGPDGALR